MRAIFLADAHLRQPHDHNYQLLLNFLNQQRHVDALFLLGDIFDFWLGYKHLAFTPYIPLLEMLRQLSEGGTKLYFVEGNHDFNIGPYFTETLNCTVIPDQKVITWEGKSILISHGDLLIPDKNYQRLRSFWRSGFVKALAKIVHPDLVWSFAMWLCSKSPKNDPAKDHVDPTPYLQSFAARSNCDIVVSGHYHHPLDLDHQGTRIIALGDWISQFSYAEMVDGEIELKQYQPPRG